MKTIDLSFHPIMSEQILSGKKICTTRYHKKAEVGDLFWAGDHLYRMMASGYFDSFESLVQKFTILGDEGRYQGIYVTLNEVNPALQARRANRIKTRLSKKDSTTTDADTFPRRWLPIDIDPVRPSGVSSSEDEYASALWLADLAKEFL